MIRSNTQSRGSSSAGIPAKTPDSGAAQVAAGARASLSIARALGHFVERLIALGADKRISSEDADGESAHALKLASVRESLRQLAARSRDGALLCRIIDGQLILEGVPIDRGMVERFPHLGLLLSRLVALNVGSLTVREGASPRELLTLGRVLAVRSGQNGDSGPNVSVVSTDTPTTLEAVSFADTTPVELLRTWSVLMTPTIEPRTPDSASVTSGGVLARLVSARTDDATASAVDALLELLDELQQRGDGTALENVVRVVMQQFQQTGEHAGRLALERALRHLLSAPLLTLLAKRLPDSTDRSTLLKLFSRAGDAGVATLVGELISTDDSLARRAYFDSIVAMDVGAAHIFAALNDSRWYVARNAAALLGEIGVGHADDALIAMMNHSDERIRVSIARALMRLRTSKSLQALQGAIDDNNNEVRRIAAAAYGVTSTSTGTGAGSVRPSAARLSAALDREVDEDATLEMLAALGKLGSADAIQRLLRIVLPAHTDITGTVAGEKYEGWLRIAALEALSKARGNHVIPVLDVLLNDEDAEVAESARDLRAQY